MEIDQEHLEEIYYDENHDKRNCEMCNPEFKIVFGEKVVEKINEFAEREGWERVFRNPVEIDTLDYETLLNDGIIEPVDEIENWMDACIVAEKVIEGVGEDFLYDKEDSMPSRKNVRELKRQVSSSPY